MEWERVRAHYERAFRASGLTQAEVAARGGLRGQNAISKLLINRRRGPSVDTLLRAIDGIGLLPSVFFLQIEDGVPATHGAAAPVRAADEQLALFRRFSQALGAFEATLRGTPAGPARRRKPRQRGAR